MNTYQKVLKLVRANPMRLLREYGDELGVTREYVRLLLKRAKEHNELPDNYDYNNRAFWPKRCGYRHAVSDKCSVCKPPPLPPIEEAKVRFWSKVNRRGESGCWIWLGCQHPTLKYGIFGAVALTERYHEYAHRVSWIINCGPIPKGLCVLHHCDNPPCVNPNHLYLGTTTDNMRDRDARGRNGRLGKRKLYCKRGHKFTKENSYSAPSMKGRTCRICANNRAREKYYRKKANLLEITRG